MDGLYTYSATWLARVRFATPNKPALTTYDCAVSLHAIARALAVDPDVIYERDGRTLAAHMVDRRDGVAVEHPYPFVGRLARHDVDRHLPRVRGPMWQQCLKRLASMTDRGVPVFARFDVDGEDVEFELAPATFDAHPALGRRRAAQGTGYLTATVDPAALARMGSVSSVNLACRLAAWWQSGTRVGVQGRATEMEVERGRAYVKVPIAEVAEGLGITAARLAPSVVDLTLGRVRDDLCAQLGLAVTTTWEPRGERARFLAVEVRDRAAQPMSISEQAALDDVRPTPAPAPAPDPVDEARPSRPGRVVVRPVAEHVGTAPRAPLPVPLEFEPAAEPVDDLAAEMQAALESDPLSRVRGFVGRDAEGTAIWEDDHRDLDIAGTWYPHVVYPAVVPETPWLAVVVERPDSEGGPCVARTRTCWHLPSPDVSSYPHMHANGVWGNLAKSEVDAVRGTGGDVHVEVCLPTALTHPVYCRTIDDYDRAIASAGDWRRPPYEHERAEFAENVRVAAMPTFERLRHEACELAGLDPDDPTVETYLD